MTLTGSPPARTWFRPGPVLFGCLLFFTQAILAAGGQEQQRNGSNQASGKGNPVRVIFDSDMAGDVDDVGALATLHALADRGRATILAVGASERNRWTPLCMDAINTYYGRTDLPIGTTKDPGAFRKQSKYARSVAKKFPRSRDWNAASDVPSAVDVYRSVLARQPDQSVVFISVGSMASMSNLLRSEPGEHSELSGVELVGKKVRHWVCMAGAFGRGEGKREANLIKGVDYARHAIQNWPTPITFCGFLIGDRIQTGSALKNDPKNNPVRHAYKRYNGLKDKSSFDLVATLYAVKGVDGGEARTYWSLSDRGRVTVHGNGSNSFKKDPDGRHRYMKMKGDPDQIKKAIETLLTRSPERK